MGRPNYSFAKRQRDLDKKKKKDEKRLKKAETKAAEAGEQPPVTEEGEPQAPVDDKPAE